MAWFDAAGNQSRLVGSEYLRVNVAVKLGRRGGRTPNAHRHDPLCHVVRLLESTAYALVLVGPVGFEPTTKGL